DKPGCVVYIRREAISAGSAGIEPLRITGARFHRGRPIIALEGIDTMTAAEALAGAELRIEADALQPLPHGSYYQHDLVGCSVEMPDGVAIGTVMSVEIGRAHV